MFGDWDWDPTDELRVATALTGVQKSLTRDGEPPPKGAKIVFTVLENVSDIEQRQHNGRRVGPTGYRTYWPPIKHTSAERAEAFKQRMIDLTAGDSAAQLFGINLAATPKEVSTAESVQRIFQSLLGGKNPNRDWRVLQFLSAGRFEWEVAEKVGGISLSRVSEIKRFQCDKIWTGVKHLLTTEGQPYPLPAG